MDLLRLGEMPHAADPVAGGLAHGRVTNEEVERLAVVADLRGAVVGAREGREVLLVDTGADGYGLTGRDRQGRPVDEAVAGAAARVRGRVLVERVERHAVRGGEIAGR